MAEILSVINWGRLLGIMLYLMICKTLRTHFCIRYVADQRIALLLSSVDQVAYQRITLICYQRIRYFVTWVPDSSALSVVDLNPSHVDYKWICKIG